IISAKQFDRDDIEYILKKGKEMINVKNSNVLNGKILATLFFEPSTRTRLSFESAMHRLGGSVIGFHSGDVSSIKKGESIADTIRTVENYSDCIVIRNPLEGAATLAAKFARIPIINAGSGSGEHPTQALLDLLTIQEECGTIDGLNIGIVGDLKYGRTVHSLSMLFANFDVNLYFISPKELAIKNRYREYLQQNKVKFKEIDKYRNVLEVLDVLYMTRIQKERFADQEEYERVKNSFVFKEKDLNKTKDNFKLLHPLPRITEITPDIDKYTDKAVFFKQTFYGLCLRKAILAELMV
ncbi:unnamed protein product, partial [marine sediment metagenome]